MAEDLHQNVRALHPAHGMLHKETDLTQGWVGSLVLITPWRVGGLLTLTRLLGRDVNPLTPVVRLYAKIA